MSQNTNTVVYVHKTVLQSWLRDAGTLVLFIALIGIGVLLDSSAMQWIGAITAFLTIAVRGSGKVKRLTIAEARQHLDELEARQ